MNKIYTWILKGTGTGKRYLFALALFFSAFSIFIVYISWNDVILLPQAQAFLTQIPMLNLPNGQIIEPDNSMHFAWILFFTLSIGLFIVFYVWSIIFTLISYLLTLCISSEQYAFSVRRRLSVVCLSFGYIIFVPLSFFGLYISAFGFVLTVLLLMCFILADLPIKKFCFLC